MEIIPPKDLPPEGAQMATGPSVIAAWIVRDWRTRLSLRMILLTFLATLAVIALALAVYQFRGGSVSELAGKASVKIGAASNAGAPAADEAPPLVEPLEMMVIPAEDARALNDQMPYSTAPNPAAPPFVFSGAPEDRLRALDCLSAAVLYEAGDDKIGQEAVAQVVLNRARHPAFPSSVCGVVFQGSERRTGCQFTFTCDGALNRSWSEGAWERARKVANSAMSGYVYSPVGTATHYHTDWVVPYWASSLDKITKVGTHLFYRWTGGWGRLPAFRQRVSGIEPGQSKLAATSVAHAHVADPVLADLAPVPTLDTEVASVTVPGTSVITTSPEGRVTGTITPPARTIVATSGEAIIVTLNAASSPESFEALAKEKCGLKSYCKVLGWTDAGQAAQSGNVSEAQRTSMSFSYLRNTDAGFEKALWNCKQFPRANKKQCMRGV